MSVMLIVERRCRDFAGSERNEMNLNGYPIAIANDE